MKTAAEIKAQLEANDPYTQARQVYLQVQQQDVKTYSTIQRQQKAKTLLLRAKALKAEILGCQHDGIARGKLEAYEALIAQARNLSTESLFDNPRSMWLDYSYEFVKDILDFGVADVHRMLSEEARTEFRIRNQRP
jgi:hypothetical protein